MALRALGSFPPRGSAELKQVWLCSRLQRRLVRCLLTKLPFLRICNAEVSAPAFATRIMARRITDACTHGFRVANTEERRMQGGRKQRQKHD